MKLTLTILAGLVLLVVLIVVGTVLATRFADGPRGPIPGGALQTGDFADAAATDWNALLGSQPVTELELQLVNPESSRTTGAFVHNGQLYIPCDLGFVWRRLPDGLTRYFLHTLWWFKTWHRHVEADGRVVMRFNGQRYRFNAVRVTDAALEREFREIVSSAAEKFFELRDIETNPEDIWFFRLDPRPG